MVKLKDKPKIGRDMVEKASKIATNELVLDQNSTRLMILREKNYFFVKRSFDIVAATLGLALTSPILLLVAIAIKLEDGGPVFFKQIRTGKNGKDFEIIKFRSCSVKNDVKNLRTGDIYTKTGKFIRKISIDELPQLVNVLRGEMSIIGPRAWITDYYKNMNPYQRRRYNVLPGITGLAQVEGRNNLTIFEKINYDIEYIENQSVKLDLKILFASLGAIFSHSGVDAGKSKISDELKQLKLHKKA